MRRRLTLDGYTLPLYMWTLKFMGAALVLAVVVFGMVSS